MKKSLRQKVGKRIASIVMSALIAFTGVGLLPQFAMPVKAADFTYNVADGNVNVTYDQDCTVEITGTSTTNTISITVDDNKTVTVTLNNVNIDIPFGVESCAFKVLGDGNVVINLVGTNVLKSGFKNAGLQKDSTGMLTISGTGSLDVTGGTYAAGIGGAFGHSCSNIKITSGTVTATGVDGGAGIGGGDNGSGSNIEISGGVVTANGGYYGAGIGGGMDGSGSNINISGGIVKATGGSYAAGIGGGSPFNTQSNGNGTNISISGGMVYAIGGQAGAGIGGGMSYFLATTASGISISGESIVFVAGGAAIPSSNVGAGVAVGTGGSGNNVSGDEIDPVTTGLYTTGSIKYYSSGTSLSNIINGTAQLASTTIGTIDPPVISSTESTPLPVDCMQEVMDDINTAIAIGGEQTVTIKGYSALSSDVMELLAEHPQITVVTEFSFDGLDYKITIPGSAVKLNPLIKWYGPKYLFPMFYMYGTDTTPSLQAYVEKYPVPVS